MARFGGVWVWRVACGVACAMAWSCSPGGLSGEAETGCASDGECVADGVRGVCLSGPCAFPNAACASGWSLEGGGRCLPEKPGGSTDTGSGDGGGSGGEPDVGGDTGAGTGEDVGRPDVGGGPVVDTDDGPLLAFPGAVGFGKDTVGGRGGRVIYVTSLEDSGPGTLREALEAQGPRTVIFRVSGTVALDSSVNIEHPNITVAGQSAPGGGIAVRHSGIAGFGAPLIYVRTSDVIIRHLRLRRGASAEGECCGDAMTLIDAERVVIDHCSMSWGTDETFNAWPASRVTVQNTIFSEALREASHEEDGMIQMHAFAFLLGNSSHDFTLHRNLFAHNTGRNPAIQGTGGQFQLTNNLIYNTCYSATLGGNSETAVTEYNAIGNWIVEGANRCQRGRNSLLIGGDFASVYVEDNLTPYRSEGDDEWMATAVFLELPPAPAGFQSASKFAMPEYPVVAAKDLMTEVLPDVGATLPMRDAVDARVVEDVVDRTGGIIDDPSEVGGWPDLSGGAPYPDADGDGMDDGWERSVGLDPGDGSDGAQDADGDGYTNLEEFLNGTAT